MLSTDLQRLWSRISATDRRLFAAVFLLSAVTAAAEVLTLGTLYPFIVFLVEPQEAQSIPLIAAALDRLPPMSRQTLLPVLTAVFVATVVVAMLLRMTLLWAQTRLTHRVGSAISVEIYRRTLHQPYRVHVNRNSSEVISVIAGKVNGVVSCVLLPLVTIASSLIMITAVAASLLLVQPVLALALLGALAGLYAAVAWRVRRRLALEGQEMSRQQVVAVRAVQEGLGGIRDILIDGTQDAFCEVYRRADTQARRSSAVIGFISQLPRFMVEGLGMILIAAAAFVLATLSHSPGGAIPVLGVLALGAQRMMPLVQGLYAHWGMMQGHAQALSEVLDLLMQPIEEPERSARLTFAERIDVCGLRFRHLHADADVLRQVNFTIRKGERVGVVGATGSGKSTLIDLLLGLLDPADGVIRVDGVPLRSDNRRAWQDLVAHVPQSIFIADTTVAENIAFGIHPDRIDRHRVEQAARRAQLWPTLQALPEGMHTRIGERGVRLSGGQRQRIGIARALYKRAQVLVLDEATSALDNETEAMVMESVRQLDRDLTIVMIAHRLTTLQECSTILEIRDGAVHLRGSYAQFTGAQAQAHALPHAVAPLTSF